MNRNILIVIIIIVVVVAVSFVYSMFFTDWFKTSPRTDGDGGDVFLSDDEILKMDQESENDSRLVAEAEETMLGLGFYGRDTGRLPDDLSDLVPEYLEQVYPDVTYTKLSDKEAMVSVKLSEADRELMSDDDGSDSTLYELIVEI